MPRYRLGRDIVIPEGTELDIAPVATRRYVKFGSIVLEDGPDNTFELTMPLENSLETGLVELIDEEVE